MGQHHSIFNQSHTAVWHVFLYDDQLSNLFDFNDPNPNSDQPAEAKVKVMPENIGCINNFQH
jgi:hypothetical protein